MSESYTHILGVCAYEVYNAHTKYSFDNKLIKQNHPQKPE